MPSGAQDPTPVLTQLANLVREEKNNGADSIRAACKRASKRVDPSELWPKIGPFVMRIAHGRTFTAGNRPDTNGSSPVSSSTDWGDDPNNQGKSKAEQIHPLDREVPVMNDEGTEAWDWKPLRKYTRDDIESRADYYSSRVETYIEKMNSWSNIAAKMDEDDVLGDVWEDLARNEQEFIVDETKRVE